MSETLTVKLLGGIRVTTLAGGDCTPSSLKARLLLSYLCVPIGIQRTRGHLAEVLWPDRSFEQANNSLRTALSELRRVLGPDVILDEQGKVFISKDIIKTDIDALDDGQAESQAVSIGEFLAGFNHDQDMFSLWLTSNRDQLRAKCVKYALARAEALQSNGDHETAKTTLLEAISLEPYSESLNRALITLHIETGERGLALAQFRTCQEVLRRELDVAPSPETIALADSISKKFTHPQREVIARAQSIDELIVARSDKSLPPSASRLAVLQFTNLGGNAEATAIVDGIVEDIITDLTKISRLKVAPRRAVMQFKGADKSLAELAAALNSRYILDGSLRMQGTRFRLNVQLVDTATNDQLWAERYDREDADIFDIQLELSQSVVQALRPQLELPERVTRVDRTTENFEAYHCYLRGRELNRGMTRRSLELARDMFRRALELDPNYIKAMIGEAMAETSLTYQYNLGAEGLEKPKATCEKALSLQPNLPEAWVVLAWITGAKNCDNECLEFLQRALELDPNYSEAYYTLGMMTLTITGDIAQALPPYIRAWELDPADLLTATSLCRALHAVGDTEHIDKVEQSTMAIAKRRVGQNPLDFEAAYTLAMLLCFRNEMDEARYWASVTTEIGQGDTRTLYFIASLKNRLGDMSAATDHLKMLLSGNPTRAKVMLIKNHPEFENLRANSEVRKLIDAHSSEPDSNRPNTF